MTAPAPPDYDGGSLVNLMAEIEHRLTGRAVSPRLHSDLASRIPRASTYVVVLYDGLGAAQLDHPRAESLAASLSAAIDAPFPTTTTVALASIATGLPPSRHGLLGYQLWMPEVELVVNTIKWTTLWGEPLPIPTDDLLPGPNLWERLAAAGREPITVQPAGFTGSPLSRLLYRGCRFDGIATIDELIDATRRLAAMPGRLILTYVPQVDFAAHVYGQRAPEYGDAIAIADRVWSALAATLPEDVVMVGTADHGHLDFPKHRQAKIAGPAHRDREFYGDGRVMFVRGEGASLAADLPATWIGLEDMQHWWGPEPRHDTFAGRAPDGVLVADDDRLLLHRHSDDRMIGNHGGLTEAERSVPLLVAHHG